MIPNNIAVTSEDAGLRVGLTVTSSFPPNVIMAALAKKKKENMKNYLIVL